MTRHVSSWKKKEVEEIRKLAGQYPVIAIADLANFPASLFQILRKKLHGKAVVKVSKTKVIRRALSESKIGSKLDAHTNNSVAVIFTQMNPFELFAFVKKNKGRIGAKPGLLAPEDIVIPAGDTGLPPGPALSDLKAAGLNPRPQGATIFLPEDKVVTRKGEPVSKAVSSVLAKLDIKPIRVGLNIAAVLENGEVFTAKVLDIDTEKVFANFVDAHRKAFNLAVNAAYPTKATTELLVQKAFNDSKAVSLEANIMNSATVDLLLAKADRQAKALAALVPEEAALQEAGKAEEGVAEPRSADGSKA
ncbi:MAG: 50S ribosomal protein L10 [Candidatus Diapherotrites archaeon]|nr:50S ribosomal protein L10 [Candidatus Diapherotrites archaeon]